ncbi:MAG: ABC transporter ATP-binding protein, partial [Romboutsia sp.]
HPKDRNIGLVFQNYALYPHMTALENIMFPLTVGKNKRSKSEAMEIAKKYMKITSIEELADKKPGNMSGGQQQRIAITRALVQSPKVLLLDEPLSNLDARLRLKIREEIRRLVKEIGITTVFVTHDQEEALSISDRIVLMNKGIVQQFDVPQKLYLEPANLFVAKFMGNPIINIFEMTKEGNVLKGEDFSIDINLLNKDRFKGELKEGKYVIGVRPEYFTLS